MRLADNRGFTATEITVLVAVILALFALSPAMHGGYHLRLIRKSSEQVSRERLAQIRSALVTYGRDFKGQKPAQLSDLAAGKYLPAMPLAKVPPYHPNSTAVSTGTVADDAGGWMYDSVPGDGRYGQVWINCTHTDTKGNIWSSY